MEMNNTVEMNNTDPKKHDCTDHAFQKQCKRRSRSMRLNVQKFYKNSRLSNEIQRISQQIPQKQSTKERALMSFATSTF